MGRRLKFLTLVIAAVLGCALPATAVAAPAIEMPYGVYAPNGTALTAESSNTVAKTPLGTLKCSSVVIYTKITKNTGSAFALGGFGSGENAAYLCYLGTTPVEVTLVRLNSLGSTVSGFGTASISFVADLPGGVRCTYSSSGTGTGVTYTSGASYFHLAGELIASPEVCGESGKVSISGDYFVTTSSGGGSVFLL